jgi:3-oxoadipate enol-lactonase
MIELPVGRPVELPGRGVTRVLEASGPAGAPTVVLIHGLSLTAEANWFGVFPVLARHFRVVALDLRGHGRGIPARPVFRLEDCADDVAALATVMRLDRFIAVGYSMGGLVAQLLWRRHRGDVAGLVLCSTSRNFLGSTADWLTALAWSAMRPLAEVSPVWHLLGAQGVGDNLVGHIENDALRRWVHAEMGRTSLATVAAAVEVGSRFSSHDWIGQVDVPTTVLVTTLDRIVHPVRQRKLAAAIPGAVVHEVQADHGVFLSAPAAFGQAVLEACLSVSARIPVGIRGVTDESA